MERLLVSLLVAASVSAQANWLVQAPPFAPPACEGSSMVFDPATQRTYLMWGIQGGGGQPSFAVHMWNGTNWTPCTYSTAGGGLLLVGRDASLADDGAGGLLMFGGWRPGFGLGGGIPTVLDQTWRVVANSSGALLFTLLAPSVRPTARQGASMVSTPLGVLLFGGSAVSGSPVYGDTWLWNGVTWTQLTPASSPSPQSNAAMAFDAARNVVVMFGGLGGAGGTWEFDGTTWWSRAPVQAPPARARAGFTWSPALGRSVLFGGVAANGVALADTWTWDGTDWESLYPITAPSARDGAKLCYDPVRQQPLLFGGRQLTTYYNDTYYLEVASSPSTYTVFGAGCVGPSAQVPSLAALPNELPRIGTTSHLVLGNLPTGSLSLPVFVLGLSNTYEASAGHGLPFDLGFLGWPGCQQRVSHDVLVPMPTLAGQVTYAMTVPLSLGLLGFAFHAQGLVLYQPTGAAVSNALTGIVGT